MTSSPPAPPGTNDQLSPIRSSRPPARLPFTSRVRKPGNRLNPCPRDRVKSKAAAEFAEAGSHETQAVTRSGVGVLFPGARSHLIRASMRFVSDTDRKRVAAALRPVYTAPTVEAAETALLEFAGSDLGRKYPATVATWENAWNGSSRSWNSHPK